MVLGYPKSTWIPRLMGCQWDPQVLGRHILPSVFLYTIMKNIENKNNKLKTLLLLRNYKNSFMFEFLCRIRIRINHSCS